MRHHHNLQEDAWNDSIIETSSINQLPASLSKQNGEHDYHDQVIHRNNIRNETTKNLLLKRDPEIGFGFSIRGGVEHGTGIFISNINKYSDAYNQSLQVGDQILKANKLVFADISHKEAVQFIQRQKSLTLVVLALGIIPGSIVSRKEYQWIDCYGRPCSPLNIKSPLQRRGPDDLNGIRLLEDDDERKVNVVVGSNNKLGSLIRGGCEYGLGVFIVGIDEDSVADRSGIMVGEQILDINGINFTNISHADAAHIIRTSKMMTMILKDVGKIPLARILLGHPDSARTRTSMEYSTSQRSPRDSVFKQGIAGRQLHHQSATGPPSYRWIEEKAQYYLTEDDWVTLKYYIREYVYGNITANVMVLALLDLFDTNEKMNLVAEVRGIVRAQDIDIFDEMILRKQVEQIKAQNEHHSRRQLPRQQIKEVKIAPRVEVASTQTQDEFSQTYQSPRAMLSKGHNYKYQPLAEETYHSTIENLTEESVLSRHPRDNETEEATRKDAELLINADVLDKIEASTLEPLYASVNKAGKDHLLRDGRLKKQRRDRSHLELNAFQSPLKEMNEKVSEENTFAFNFLNSEDSTFLNGKHQSPLKPAFVERKHSSDTDDEESVVSVSSLENCSPYSPAEKVTKKKPRHEINSNHSNRRQKTSVIDIDEQSANSFQNFQPKSLKTNGSFKEDFTASNDIFKDDLAVPDVLIEQPSPIMNREKTNRPSTLNFDINPSIERRYSNFSVNDIIRQDFLPTTRLDYNHTFSSNESDNQTNSFEENRERKLSKLNIQNQYQSERTRTPSFETPLKLDEPKTYGKPVMTKSPRADYSISSSTNSTVKRNKQLTPDTEIRQRHLINIPKLRKTKNSIILLGNPESNVDENQTEFKTENDNTNDKFSTHIFTGNETKAFPGANSVKKSYLPDNIVPSKDVVSKSKNEITFKLQDELRATYNSPKRENHFTDKHFKTNSIKAKMEAFSKTDEKTISQTFGVKTSGIRNKPQIHPKPSLETLSKRKLEEKIVELSKNYGEPGFVVDSREIGYGNELFISEIENSSLHSIDVGDIITGVDNKPFKKGLKKGLANLIIRNAFSSPERSHVKLTLITQK